jgi:hypothetical protein
MSYRTTFEGEFTLDRPLTVEHYRALEAFAGERHDDVGPSVWCDWVPNDVGSAIVASDREGSFYEYVPWLEHIIGAFLKPWGYVLNGRVTWAGEEDGDLGVIVVRDNEVRSANAVITYLDPFADD